jgi:hypothetical protein
LKSSFSIDKHADTDSNQEHFEKLNLWSFLYFKLRFEKKLISIGGGAIRLGEAQASLELETEGLERLNFVYIFCSLRRPDKKMGNLTHFSDNWCANSSDPYTYVKQYDTQGVTNKLQ